MATQTALILGDTHALGSWGKAIESLLLSQSTRQTPIRVTRVGVEGAGAYHYNRGLQKQLPGKKMGNFADAIAKKYTLAILLLGTEDAAQFSQREAAREILDLYRKVKAFKKLVVLPPPYSKEFANSYKISADDVRLGKDLNYQIGKVAEYLAPILGGDGYMVGGPEDLGVNKSATDMDLKPDMAKEAAIAVVGYLGTPEAAVAANLARELAPESEIEPAPVEEPPQQQQQQEQQQEQEQQQQAADSQESTDLPASRSEKKKEEGGSKMPYIVAGVGLLLLIGAAVVRSRKGQA